MAQKFIHKTMFHQHNLIVIFRAKCGCFLKGLNHAINSGNSTRYIQPRVILAYLARFPFQLGMWHQIMWFRVMQTPGFSQDHHYTNLLFKILTAFQRGCHLPHRCHCQFIGPQSPLPSSWTLRAQYCCPHAPSQALKATDYQKNPWSSILFPFRSVPHSQHQTICENISVPRIGI